MENRLIEDAAKKYCKENANPKHSNEYGLMRGYIDGYKAGIQKGLDGVEKAIELAHDKWVKDNPAKWTDEDMLSLLRYVDDPGTEPIDLFNQWLAKYKQSKNNNNENK